MIVSRSVLKEIRSKGTVNTRQSREYQRLLTKEMQSNVGKQGNDYVLLKDDKQNQKKNNKIQRTVSITKPPTTANQQQLLLKTQQKTSSIINLSNQAIRQLKPNLFNQPSIIQIRQLNLSHNQIKQILPTILVPFQFLQLLDLSFNNLQKISFPYNKMCLKELRIQENKLVNLNLQHLKCLQHIKASKNKLIFITLPQSIKHVNFDNNMLANTYFIEKCINIQHLSINSNFIYDLNFNSMNQLQVKSTKNTQKTKAFTNLRTIECSNNKICHLNGFQNLKSLKCLKMDNNELVLSRESVNQFLFLQSVQHLFVGNNPQQQGVYLYEEFETILFNRLQNLKSINSKQNRYTKHFNQSQQQQQQQRITNFNNQSDNFHLFQSSHKKEINDQSTIKQNQLSMECSGEKPFRLFLDDDKDDDNQCEQSFQNSFLKPPKQQSFQRIYTLGDMDDKVEGQCYNDNDYNDVFQKMTLSNRNGQQTELTQQKDQYDLKATTNNCDQNNQKISSLQKSNLKIQQLQKQMSKSSSRIFIPVENKKYQQKPSLQITQQTKSLLKMIYEMSFLPPQPIKYSSKSLKISKRLDQDEDEYFLFTKLLQKRKGILYLKKIFLLQENDQLFQIQGNTLQGSKDYELGFFNAPNLQEIYKKMVKYDCLLGDLLDTKIQSNLANYLSPIPGAFGCHHIAVRYLNKKASAFDQRNLTPVCYLIESKMI